VSDLVSREQIEGIVGAPRHPTEHLARAVSAERTVYLLHSAECLVSGRDLRECGYSLVLDGGIDEAHWDGWEDRPVSLVILPGFPARLVPREMPR
jgi:hypothetical protein